LAFALTAALALAVVAGCVVTVLGFLDGRAFPGELLAIFRVQILAAALALAAVCALAGQRWFGAVALGLAVVNALGLVPAVAAGGRPDPADPTLRLLVANVWYPGHDYAPLLDLVEREKPDVVALIELTEDWAEGVSSGLAAYRHRTLQAQSGAYGIGIYSRVPLKDARIVYPAAGWPAVARASVTVDARSVELFVVHGPAPIRRAVAARHRDFMRGLGTLAADAGETALVCGDFNAAPWTAPYQELRDRGRLERDDPWRPFEWTYPVWNRLLHVPIDHCLASSAVAVASRRGPTIGSDHLPLLVDVALLSAG
jgi:endonuclease/exonuclease/phosphatase (EEP) superfamily protein YafD